MRRFACVVLLGVMAIAVGLGAVNWADYVRFYRAWNVDKRLTEETSRRLAAAVSSAEEQGHWRADRQHLPPDAQRIGALSASFYPRSSDLLLYDNGDVYVYVRVRTSATNQEIFTFTNGFGRQRTKHLWTRDPARARQLNPIDRTLTVSEWSMARMREWIIRPGEVMVVDRGTMVGSDDTLVARHVLSPTQHRTIEAAAAAIPSTLRGHFVTSGVLDGISLRVCYTRAGIPDAQDFELANTWTEAADPLIEALARCLPPEHGPKFKQVVIGEEHAHPSYQKSYTWAEREELEPVARVPWWCVWRRWVHGQRLTSTANLKIDAWTFWAQHRRRD